MQAHLKYWFLALHSPVYHCSPNLIHTPKSVCIKHTCLPSKHRVWLPSRHTQISKHCSSRLKNKTNLRKRSWVCMVTIHCKEHKFRLIQIQFISRSLRYVCEWSFRMCLFLTSGVSVLRCEMNAGTDMMWRRKDLSRLSEKCAATTGLKHTRTESSSHYLQLHRNRATDVIRPRDVSESKPSSHGNRPEWQRKNGSEGSFGKGRSGSCQSICK